MKTGLFQFTSASVAAFLMCIDFTNLSPSAISADAEESKATAPQVVLAETYNAVTRIYFTNTAVHKGFAQTWPRRTTLSSRCKVLADARQILRGGELSIGNPPLVDLVRRLGSKNLPETGPTTLSAMA